VRSGLWLLPGIRRFSTACAEELASGRSLAVVTPAWLASDEFWALLRTELSGLGAWFHEVRLTTSDANDAPAALLGDRLDVAWEPRTAPRTAEYLCACELPNVVVVSGVGELADEAQRRWLRFLGAWAEAAKSRADAGRRPVAMCFPLSAREGLDAGLPDADTHLSTKWLWAVPDALESHLLCRTVLGGSRDPESRWREHVLADFCGGDVQLIELLWDTILGSRDDVFVALGSYAQEHGWDSEWLEGHGVARLQRVAGDVTPTSGGPPGAWRPAWSCGLLSATPEYGMEVHPAALVALGAIDDAEHRLWRGQARLLLPEIDSLRMAMCRGLTQRFGRKWAFAHGQPILEEEQRAVRESPLACGWGHLEFLVSRRKCFPEFLKWTPLLAAGRRIRNSLAHGRAIEFEDFVKLEAEASRSGLREALI